MIAKLARAAMILALSAVCAVAHAQDFPSKTIRIIVPFGPGSGPDVVARALSEGMSKELGRPVIVENKTGAAGNLAARAVLDEKHDGHALLLVGTSGVTMNPELFTRAGFTAKDFRLVAPLADISIFLLASSKVNARTAQDLIALVKSQPGKFNYSAPTGTPHQMAGELLAQMAGLEWTRVSFRDPSQVINEMLSGSVQFAFSLLPSVKTYVDDGRLHLIGITSAKRAPTHLDIPTIGETVRVLRRVIGSRCSRLSTRRQARSRKSRRQR